MAIMNPPLPDASSGGPNGTPDSPGSGQTNPDPNVTTPAESDTGYSPTPQDEVRATAVVEAFNQLREAQPDEPVYVGEVGFVDIKPIESAPNEGFGVEIYLTDAEDAEPSFRIFNPPLLVGDPTGDIVRENKRYREDPVAAVAEVISNYRKDKR